LLAIQFARALRRPMNALAQGALELQQGNLAHRVRWNGADEFAAVANSMNAMAMELQSTGSARFKRGSNSKAW